MIPQVKIAMDEPTPIVLVDAPLRSFSDRVQHVFRQAELDGFIEHANHRPLGIALGNSHNDMVHVQREESTEWFRAGTSIRDGEAVVLRGNGCVYPVGHKPTKPVGAPDWSDVERRLSWALFEEQVRNEARVVADASIGLGHFEFDTEKVSQVLTIMWTKTKLDVRLTCEVRAAMLVAHMRCAP